MKLLHTIDSDLYYVTFNIELHIVLCDENSSQLGENYQEHRAAEWNKVPQIIRSCLHNQGHDIWLGCKRRDWTWLCSPVYRILKLFWFSCGGRCKITLQSGITRWVWDLVISVSLCMVLFAMYNIGSSSSCLSMKDNCSNANFGTDMILIIEDTVVEKFAG